MSSHDVDDTDTKLWKAPETRNSVLAFHDPVDTLLHVLYRQLAIDNMQLALAPVVVDQRLCLLW